MKHEGTFDFSVLSNDELRAVVDAAEAGLSEVDEKNFDVAVLALKCVRLLSRDKQLVKVNLKLML